MSDLTRADSGLIRLQQNLRLPEQRSRTRYPTCREAMVRPLTATMEQRQPAVICNVSESGLGLFMFTQFKVGTLLLVEFDSAPVNPRVVRVAHATEDDEGITLGCELERMFTAAELQALRESEA